MTSMGLMIGFFVAGVILGLFLFFEGADTDNYKEMIIGLALIILLTLVFIGFCRIENLIADALVN